MSGYTFAVGPCFTCGNVFTFDPELVPSVIIDPATGRPADVTASGEPIELDDNEIAEAYAQGARVPLCADCVETVNIARLRRGHRLIPILPGAYPHG